MTKASTTTMIVSPGFCAKDGTTLVENKHAVRRFSRIDGSKLIDIHCPKSGTSPGHTSAQLLETGKWLVTN